MFDSQYHKVFAAVHRFVHVYIEYRNTHTHSIFSKCVVLGIVSFDHLCGTARTRVRLDARSFLCVSRTSESVPKTGLFITHSSGRVRDTCDHSHVDDDDDDDYDDTVC